MTTTLRGSTGPAVDRAVQACIRCAVDRYWAIGTLHAYDRCASECIAAATAMLTMERHEPAYVASVLTSCAYACESAGDSAGRAPTAEYVDCARRCRQVAGHLASVTAASMP